MGTRDTLRTGTGPGMWHPPQLRDEPPAKLWTPVWRRALKLESAAGYWQSLEFENIRVHQTGASNPRGRVSGPHYL